MLDWYVCIPVGAGTAVIVALWGEWRAHRMDGESRVRLVPYLVAPMIGVVALLVGSGAHAELQWLQVLGTGIAVGAALTALCTALVVLVDRAWLIVPGALVLLALGALALADGSRENSWCLRYGSLSTLGDCIGSFFGIVLGWLLVGCGAVLGLVLAVHRLLRHQSRART